MLEAVDVLLCEPDVGKPRDVAPYLLDRQDEVPGELRGPRGAFVQPEEDPEAVLVGKLKEQSAELLEIFHQVQPVFTTIYGYIILQMGS